MDRLARTEGELHRLAGDVSALLQVVQQQQMQLTQVLQRLSDQTPPPAPVPVVPLQPVPAASTPLAPEPKVGHPERFDGDPTKLGAFLTTCRIQFALQPRTFASDTVKVGYVVNQLTGRALQWGAAEFDRQSPACASFEALAAEMQKVFDAGSPSEHASSALLNARQGNRSVADFSIHFRTLAGRSLWNEAALVDTFLRALSDYVKDCLVAHDRPSTLDEAIALAVRIDRRVQDRRREKGRPPAPASQTRVGASSVAPPASSSPPRSVLAEPMEVGRARLSTEERRRRLTANLCLYCGGAGHRAATCPLKDGAHRT